MSSPAYVPINCDFHSLLEDHATTRKPVLVSWLDEQGRPQDSRLSLVDVYSRAGEEFLRAASGETIRLDRLLAVDGVALAGFDAGTCAL